MRTLADLEFFSEVARLRSFAKAASRLGTTPSTLTRRIAALEQELGVTLIIRSTRTFALTAAGQAGWKPAQNILSEFALTKEELQTESERTGGDLRIGAPGDLVCTMLMPLLARHAGENKGLILSLLSTQGQPDLIRDSLDIAFVVVHQNRLVDSAFATHAIGSFPRMLYASDTYLSRQGAPSSPADLPMHACVRHLGDDVETHWTLLRGKQKRSVPITGDIVCSSVLAGAQAAREHLGIAMLPAHLATHPSYGDGLARVLSQWQGKPAYILALTADRFPSRRSRGVLSAVRDGFRSSLQQLETRR